MNASHSAFRAGQYRRSDSDWDSSAVGNNLSETGEQWAIWNSNTILTQARLAVMGCNPPGSGSVSLSVDSAIRRWQMSCSLFSLNLVTDKAAAGTRSRRGAF